MKKSNKKSSKRSSQVQKTATKAPTINPYPTRYQVRSNASILPSQNFIARPYVGTPPPIMWKVTQIPLKFQNIIVSQKELKKSQLSKCLFISGFQKTLTVSMLEKHISNCQKPLDAIKFPISKYNQNKGFAFVYFESRQDARIVAKKINGSVILRNKIKVTKTVDIKDLSKIIIKFKTNQVDDQGLRHKYFNEDSLQTDISRVIQTTIQQIVQVNNVIIPTISKKNNQKLDYARLFIAINDLRQCVATARRDSQNLEELQRKNQKQIVQSYIVNLLNRDQRFSLYACAQIYKPAQIRRKYNVLHIRGIDFDKGLYTLKTQLKEWINFQDLNVEIIDIYVGKSERKQLWANIEFINYQDTKIVYQYLKTKKIMFQNKIIFATIRNSLDLRTVLFQKIKIGIEKNIIENFLTDLANGSNFVSNQMKNYKNPIRLYDYFNFDIVEPKKFYINNQGSSINFKTDEKVPKSWRFSNNTSRRLIINFFTEMDSDNIINLIQKIKSHPLYYEIFQEDVKQTRFKALYFKGHMEENVYVRHFFMQPNKRKPMTNQRFMMPRRLPILPNSNTIPVTTKGQQKNIQIKKQQNQRKAQQTIRQPIKKQIILQGFDKLLDQFSMKARMKIQQQEKRTVKIQQNMSQQLTNKEMAYSNYEILINKNQKIQERSYLTNVSGQQIKRNQEQKHINFNRNYDQFEEKQIYPRQKRQIKAQKRQRKGEIIRKSQKIQQKMKRKYIQKK